jgi:hypothetical protein
MTERPSGQGRPDDWARGYSGEQYSGEQYSNDPYYNPGSADQGMPGQGGPGFGQRMPGPSQGMPGPGQEGPGFGQGMPGPGQGTPGPGQGMAGPGMAPTQFQPAMPRQAADSRSFLSALFDFSFTSFVTVRIIKVLYVLILILTSLYALVFTIVAFKAGPVIGLATLLIGDPLFIIIVMAFWRLVLESFVVIFRIAEDTREIRERGENR